MKFNAPINSLSLGNVSFNILRELIRKNQIDGFVPMKNNADVSAFRYDEVLFKKMQALVKPAINFEDEVLKCWHINESAPQSQKQSLYTFYEVDSPTNVEIDLVNQQNHTYFSSSEAAEVFRKAGCPNVSHVPLGFDEEFSIIDTPKVEEVTNFSLIGKMESRKNTARIIKLWLNEFGNNPKYQLTCLINNPFYPPRLYEQKIQQILGGHHYSNINFVNFLKSNAEVNQLYNAMDIDLSGISNGEGWGLPAFNMTCLGKWSVVSNCSGHKDWAHHDNAILIEPEGKQPCYDNEFFKQGLPFNQGDYYLISDDAILNGMYDAIKKTDINREGIKTGKRLTYSNTVSLLKK